MATNKVFYWALRERATKRLLPRTKVATRAEFEDTAPPRLFNTPGAAKQALDCWRMGHWRNDMDAYGEGDGPIPSIAKYNVEIAARRQATAVDVVPMRLISA